MNTQQLLDQAEKWKTSDCMLISLDEMEHSHRVNTLAFLRRRAAFLLRAYRFCEGRYGQFGMDVRPITPELEAEASTWLETRPLIIALDRLVRHGDAIDAEVTEVIYDPRELVRRQVARAALERSRSAVDR